MKNATSTDTAKEPIQFSAWWYDYAIKNGIGAAAKKQREAARAAWEAAAVQNVPFYAVAALIAASKHVVELREAWRRGVFDERDGNGPARSNRNVDVDVAVRNALELMSPQ